MKGLARFAIAAAFAFAPVTAHADMKALEEAAKKEGELTWYVAHYTSEGAEELGARLHRDVPASRATSCAPRRRSPISACCRTSRTTRSICDVFSSTDVGHYVRLKAEGRLEKYTPENDVARSSPAFRNFDPDGYYPHDLGRPGRAHLQHRPR